MAGESLANLFAYRLLVPSCWFAIDAKTMDYDLLALKKRYATSSHEVLAWRFLDLPEPCIITIIDDDRSKNAFGLLMSLNMLIETEHGFDYTAADCMRWMSDAGFSRTRAEHLVGPDSMVIGLK